MSKVPNVVAGMYKVGKRLGGGSFGEIYAAVNVLKAQEVAIKFVKIFIIH